MKERVTLTIDHDLLEKIDHKVDGSEIKNRSHAVELFLRRDCDPRLFATGLGTIAADTGERLHDTLEVEHLVDATRNVLPNLVDDENEGLARYPPRGQVEGALSQ